MQLNQQHIHIPQPQTQFQSEIIVAADVPVVYPVYRGPTSFLAEASLV